MVEKIYVDHLWLQANSQVIEFGTRFSVSTEFLDLRCSILVEIDLRVCYNIVCLKRIPGGSVKTLNDRTVHWENHTPKSFAHVVFW